MEWKDAKIVIGVPAARDPLLDIRLAAWCNAQRKRYGLEYLWPQTDAPEAGRNSIIEVQLARTDIHVTHIFFCDADTIAPLDTIPRLFMLDKPVAAGVTPILVQRTVHCWNCKEPDGVTWRSRYEDLPKEPFPSRHVGGTTILVRRDVLEAVGWPWFKMERQPMNDKHEITKRGEDIFFCDRVAECGFEIWVDPSVVCDHFTRRLNLLTFTEESTVFPGNARQI